jgi:AcrR family transcriptional regulator
MSTDKRKNIYEAVLSLINEKRDMFSIKVADIAERADMGKGTIYEYFESKEQLIAQAIIYSVNVNIQSLESNVTDRCTFKESYFKLMSSIGAIMDNNMTLFRYMALNEHDFSMKRAMEKVIKEQFESIRDTCLNMFEKLADKGLREGLIRAKPPRYQVCIAANNSMMCLYAHKQRFKEFICVSEEELEEKAYEMFLKLLN